MTDPEGTRLVRLLIEIPEGVALTEDTVLRVRVEDASMADRQPPVLARTEVPLPDRPPEARAEVTISIPQGLVDDARSYTAFVHLDASGSGEVSSGDALSVSSVPVLTHGHPDRAEVRLQQL